MSLRVSLSSHLDVQLCLTVSAAGLMEVMHNYLVSLVSCKYPIIILILLAH